LFDELFGSENFVGQIVVQKTGGLGTSGFKAVADYLLWYTRSRDKVKYRQLYKEKAAGDLRALVPTMIESSHPTGQLDGR
jgi:adenine-specific DNA-methyltransferase